MLSLDTASTGNTYESKVSTIIPDFFVENRDGELILTLNTGEISELHVSREYQQMLKEQAQIKSKDNRAAALFLKDKINAAYTFIDAINLRNETLRKTMTAILQRQKEFFLVYQPSPVCATPSTCRQNMASSRSSISSLTP